MPLITVWLQVRVLPGPPRTLSKREISRSVEKSAGLAAFRASVHSPESDDLVLEALWAPFSPVPKSRFPETETAVAETGSTELSLRGEAEHLALAWPVR